ncbi:uncharacterized protein EV422DRAFT_517715 [Fimicolochytrium jonesii]|uniref:uncharacterized protein n=1 Tax=Fimicolochytrium jonesii TaxID=1396493 RepID=UPI0022FEC69E|nr:uncharacterized protein EV422DRAFT_517715 [Fimicolochytrium jonesii]KAI8825169.1 hypothetical protein EV422DRAFT_517715 [Fimicolochytrium jonesii]
MPSPPRNKETKPSPSPSPLSDVFSFFQPISAAASNAITFATEKLSSPTSSSDKVNTSSQSPLPDFPLFKRSGRSPTHPPGPPRRSSSLPSLYQKNDTPPPPAADPLDSAAQGDVEGTFDFMAKVPSLGMFGLGSFADYSRGISDQGDSDEDYESIESLELQQLDADGKPDLWTQTRLLVRKQQVPVVVAGEALVSPSISHNYQHCSAAA